MLKCSKFIHLKFFAIWPQGIKNVVNPAATPFIILNSSGTPIGIPSHLTVIPPFLSNLSHAFCSPFRPIKKKKRTSCVFLPFILLHSLIMTRSPPSNTGTQHPPHPFGSVCLTMSPPQYQIKYVKGVVPCVRSGCCTLTVHGEKRILCSNTTGCISMENPVAG